MRNLLLLFVFFFCTSTLSAQKLEENLQLKKNFLAHSVKFNKKRTVAVSATAAGLYGASLIGLNEFWYKNFPRSSFHFYDDSDEWLMVDKFGHAQTAYFQGAWGYQLYKWAGVKHKTATLIGGSIGFINQTIIEILDGHSEQWGWSNFDILANTTGPAAFIVQNLTFKEQRILFKFGYSPANYEKRYADNIQKQAILDAADKWFGSGNVERIVKDYNAQTYWVSANVRSFLSHESKFPEWLNVAVGTGAEQMLHSTNNNDQGINLTPYRQFYLSPDIDFTKIKTDNHFLKTLFFVLNTFKMPLPGLEYSKVNGLKFNALAF